MNEQTKKLSVKLSWSGVVCSGRESRVGVESNHYLICKITFSVGSFQLELINKGIIHIHFSFCSQSSRLVTTCRIGILYNELNRDKPNPSQNEREKGNLIPDAY